MKTSHPIVCATAVCGLFIAVNQAVAQGSLTPPGAPGLTFRTLLDVEPRFPIYHYGTNLTRSGSYYLATNLVSTSTATNTDGITISTDNVTLDLNGFAIINSAGDDTQSDGITFVSRKNVTIRNGTVQGCLRGIFANGNCAGVLVENMRFATNYLRGITLNLTPDAPGGIVRNNFVYSTGGTTVGAANQEIRGIECCCASFVVENNTVQTVFGKGTAAGYGIHLSNSSDTFAVNNRVSRAAFGIRMNGPNEYRDNLTSNCDTNYVAGTDRGNNF